MYSTVLSVLLMGMLPFAPERGSIPPLRIKIAPPALIDERREQLTALRTNLTASGVVILDLASGQEIFSKQAQVRRPMASLTKLMTALLIVENHDLDQYLEVPARSKPIEGHTVQLAPGDALTIGNWLTALLVDSANDAADTLAKFHSGSTAEFVEAMNERARVLGLRDTTFANPIGFDDPDQSSTPRDMAWLMAYVLRQPQIQRRLSIPTATIRSRDGVNIVLTNTHELLRQVSPVIAGKTGTTEAAGECLLSVVEEDGRMYLVVLLGSQQRYRDMQLILHALASA